MNEGLREPDGAASSSLPPGTPVTIPERRPAPALPPPFDPDVFAERAAPPREAGLPPASPAPPSRGRTYAYRSRWMRGAAGLIDALGGTLFRPRERPLRIDRVLLMRPDHLGDVVFSLPALRALRERLPEARIDFLIHPSARPLLLSDPDRPLRVNLIDYAAPWLQRPNPRRFAPDGVGHLAGILRQRSREIGGRYDLAIDLRGDFYLILAARLAGVRHLVGRGITGLGFLLDAEGEEAAGRHQVEGSLRLIERAGFGPVETALPELWLSREERGQARTMLRAKGAESSRLLIGVHPGAGQQTKLWGADNYARLIVRAVKELPAQVVLLGGPDDRDEAAAVMLGVKRAGAEERVIDLCGKMASLRTFMAVAKECALFVGNDSGPGHIAAALGVPLLSIFSGTNDPAEWGPRGPSVVIIRKRIECEGCGLTFCDHHSCMVQLDHDAVFDAVRKCVSG